MIHRMGVLMDIPLAFRQKIVGAMGEEGRMWLERLPELIEEVGTLWSLEYGGPVENLSYNYVVYAVDEGEAPVIVKFGLPGLDFNNESKATSSYGGERFVKLLRADHERGVIMLERLLPGRMLKDEANEDLVLEVFMDIWRATRRPIPDGLVVPKVADWAKGIARFRERFTEKDELPISEELLKVASTCFQEIMESTEVEELLHGDLHHENILYSSERGWVGIDPKGLAGDPYFDTIQFMNNQLHNKVDPRGLLEKRVDTLVAGLGLNRERLLKAGVAMATLFACWAVEDLSGDWRDTYLTAQWFWEMLGD